jgi:outer membrane protein OmpA-like peptidoglycan-associated protein
MLDRKVEKPADTKSHKVRETGERQAEEDVLSLQRDALAQVACWPGGASSANVHAATLNRATGGDLSRGGPSLLRLQRQYGNRYVQRVLAQGKRSDDKGEATPDMEQTIERARGGVQVLDSGTRAGMESSFGADFSGVRVHTGAEADTLNRALNARAFATGRDVFVRQRQEMEGELESIEDPDHDKDSMTLSGEMGMQTEEDEEGIFNPGTTQGKHLPAPELTRTFQQGGASSKRSRKLQTVTPSIQLLGDLTKVPPGLPCPVATGSPGGTTTPILFGVSSSTLSGSARSTIQGFVTGWRAGGARGNVRIDGYASTDGPDPLNWTLSCNRAMAVRTEMVSPSNGAQGIPAGQINLFAHGETSEFSSTALSPNRRALISGVPGPPSPPPSVTGVLTARDNFAGRSVNRFGLAEVVDLSFTTTPPRTAASMGGLQWRVASGGGTLVADLIGGGTYTASGTPAAVTLELTVATGPHAATVVSTHRIFIVAPSGSYMEKQPGTNIRHINGNASVGFRGLSYLLPRDVSFSNIERREGNATGVGIGFYGYLNGRVHATGSWFTVGPGNIATGCLVNTVDTVFTGAKGPPYSVGFFLWPIERQYRVGTGAPVTFTIANHIQWVDAAGKATITKHGAGPFSRNAADPTSTY